MIQIILLALIISLLLVPLNKYLSTKFNIISYPRERDAHTKPIPRMGGLSIVLSFLIVSVYGYITILYSHNAESTKFLGILVGAIILYIVGILDDIYQIKATHKLFGQIIAVICAMAGGVEITFLVLDNPGILASIVYILKVMATFIWIIGMINAMNLVDGLDGLASGIAIIASICFMVIAICQGNIVAVILVSALAGAVLGFLPYNFRPASIFMGDTGSMILGYTLAIVASELAFEFLDPVCIIAPVLILGVPIFDTASAILRRLINHKPIFEADKEHTHHKLMANGFSHKTSVIILYVFSACFGILGVLLKVQMQLKYVVVAIVVLIILLKIISKKTTDDVA